MADEHLERNLRHRSSRFGDLLKTLNAFAFQHQSREFPVSFLLTILGEQAHDVLTRVPLGAAWKEGHVSIGSGRLLREMDNLGLELCPIFPGFAARPGQSQPGPARPRRAAAVQGPFPAFEDG